MKTMTLKKGGRFMARWPDTQYYYWSTLIEQTDDKWKIQFDDGTIAVVKETDLHESLPEDARNQVGRVTRSSPNKNRKRPEEIRRSPARKLRKLFTDEDNVKLGAELSTATENGSGTANVRPSSRERSVSVPKETEGVKHSAAGVHPSSRERSVSVSRERADVTHGASGVRSSPYKRPDSVTRETKDVTRAATDVRSSPFRRSVSVTKETEDVTRDTGDVRGSPFRPSISVTIQNENVKGGVADIRPSPLKSSLSVEVQKESVTRNVTRYTESYRDRDFRRQLWKDDSVGSTHLRSYPIRSDGPLRERENLTHDVKSYVESFLDRDFRRQLFDKESTIGSAALRPSPIRGTDSLLNERGKATSDLRKYTESYLDRDFRKQLVREGSVGISPSPYRRSVSVTKENKYLTSGTTFTKYNLKDYEKKHLFKYPMEFGGRFGTLLLILLLPLYIMSLFVFRLVPDPTKFEVLFPKHLLLIPPVAFGVIMLLLLQAALTTVPIGAVASGPLTKIGILNMRCNGILAAALTFILTSSACYFKREVAGIVVSVYTEAAVSAMLLGILFALILYKRADKLPISYLNPYGCTAFKFYDFWMGREVTPRIGKFNVKLILHRFSLIIVIMLNVLIVTKAYFQGEKEDILISLMISTVLQSLYCLHFLFHEDIYLYSFLAISEGAGYMITVGYMTFPFILTFTTKVILDYRLKASLAEICIALCAYTVGHWLLESSSNRKTLSVRDPITSVWKMKVLPKWDPNVHTRAYLGEIIIYWAFAMVAGTTYLGLFIIPAAFTFSVLSRAIREYTRCPAFRGDKISTK